MFSEWRKFVASTSGRHFVLKFEAGGGGYRIFVTDFEQLWLEEVATEADLAQILKVTLMGNGREKFFTFVGTRWIL